MKKTMPSKKDDGKSLVKPALVLVPQWEAGYE
jgi:hypothetical protein